MRWRRPGSRKRKFSGLRSRCTTFIAWQCATICFFVFFLFLVLWGRKRRRYGDGAKLSSIYVPHNNTKTKKHHHHHYSTLTDTIVRISAAASRSR